jgi:FkbM family methyltransferase
MDTVWLKNMKQIIKKIVIKMGLYEFAFGIKDGFNKKSRLDFYARFIGKGDLCFDVGANFGNRTEIFLRLGAKVVAIEPQKKCYEYLRKKYGHKIAVVAKGLGEREGAKKMYIANTSVLSSLSTRWINSVKDKRFGDFNWNKTVEVELTTLDHLINRYGIPKFCKIDVEGYEPEVLGGLNKKINIISFEYTVPEQTDNIYKCIDKLLSIDDHYLFNYSIGESMKLELDHSVDFDNFKKIIKAEIINTKFGDIYVSDKDLCNPRI